MQSIAKQGGIEDIEVLNFIFDGISGSVANINLLMTAQTLSELKRLINRYYDRYLKLDSTITPRRSAVSTVKPKMSNTAVKQAATSDKETHETPLCYNCSKRGHIKPNCPYPVRPEGSCFRCWQVGHSHQSCPNPRKILKPMGERAVAAVHDWKSCCDEVESLSLSN
ncbi:uncharacterized protein LOC118757016 [Rhagoletis pomonella]|uniref:uncharacterized protein LOC118757016 n=1 Tax=Rhagoletis pomonella TaxID=28610 RepID=UPI00177C89ED|nr:uncharacterized protein LOC118757016 [Rhagoletis pomonella]